MRVVIHSQNMPCYCIPLPVVWLCFRRPGKSSSTSSGAVSRKQPRRQMPATFNKSSAVAEISDRLAAQSWPEKWGGCCAPFPGGAGFPPNTMSHGPRPTSVPSGILIYPTVWPQYINVTDKTDKRMVRSTRRTVPLFVTVAQTRR